MQQNPRNLLAIASTVLLGLVPLAAAHGDGHNGDMTMAMGAARPTIPHSNSTVAGPGSYFQYGEHTGLLFLHILLMTVAWVFVLPIGVMLSISRTRYALSVQFVFLSLNAVGVLLVTIYNASTPDLYPNDAHHKLGWVLTWIVSAQILMGLISAYTRRHDGGKHTEQHTFTPVSTEAMAQHQRDYSMGNGDRFSNDSGQGTEHKSDSLRSQSISSSRDDNERSESRIEKEHEEKHGLLHGSKVDRFLSSRIPGLLSLRVLRIFQFLYDVVDRVILLLGFAGLLTGIVTYGGLFMRNEVFNGLAHFVKGGVFFWFGIFSLGRWAGCFAEMGWAWNIKPTTSKRPSAEFVECFLIFFYGATNVFLEHLAAWGGEWSAQDFEHISITIMFLGGGLCGMLIESSRIRNLLSQQPVSKSYYANEQDAMEPKNYRFSMNPIPALIVALLGMMMSSHHQASMFSTIVHKQWGTLLVGGALARTSTYVVFYVAPPTSVLPGRPPTELITAFCLMAGGAIFMASARDTVVTMESHNLEAMFVFTVTLGFIMLLMAWVIIVIAIKGWAVKKERWSSTDFARRSASMA